MPWIFGVLNCRCPWMLLWSLYVFSHLGRSVFSMFLVSFFVFSLNQCGRAQSAEKKTRMNNAILDPYKHDSAHIAPTVLGTPHIALLPTPVGRYTHFLKGLKSLLRFLSLCLESIVIFAFLSLLARKSNAGLVPLQCTASSRFQEHKSSQPAW